jgi:peroxiredoxin
MKKITITIFLTVLIGFVNAQDENELAGKRLPNIAIKTLTGSEVSTVSLNNGELPFVIYFWVSWCKPCIFGLNEISNSYSKWQNESKFKLISISIDKESDKKSCLDTIQKYNWKFQILFDYNSNFRKSLSIAGLPSVLIVDSKGNILWASKDDWEYNSTAEEVYDNYKMFLNQNK